MENSRPAWAEETLSEKKICETNTGCRNSLTSFCRRMLVSNTQPCMTVRKLIDITEGLALS